MNDTEKGTVAENAVALQYLKLGYDVLWPSGGGKSYDFILLKDNKYQKVQVKKAHTKKGILTFNVRNSIGRSYVGLADLFGVYYQELDRVFVIPVDKIHKHYGALHLYLPRRKRAGQLNACDYELKAA